MVFTARSREQMELTTISIVLTLRDRGSHDPQACEGNQAARPVTFVLRPALRIPV